ncbi:MAG: hypothetical protein LQ342_002616 [Letrouitia transgressa]|nr:MAG: hypothetical protein LQ342_002616 [Letrouitia transgressa]
MADAVPKDDRPAVLLVGGLGAVSRYIGRFFANYLHTNKLCSSIRLVDKVLPQLARLAPEFLELIRLAESLSKIFTPPSSSPHSEYTYVFNLGGETRYSQEDNVYRARSLQLTINLSRECARRKIPYVEFSTGQVYKAPSSGTVKSGGCKEDAQLKPWTKLAKYKLEAEEALEALRKEQGLRYAILRLGHVYGRYDVGFLARGLCLAKVYEWQGKEMKWLWTKELRVNTVHVEDVCTAAWAAAKWCSSAPAEQEAGLEKRAFNIVDEGDTSQGTLATVFGSLFELKTGFQGGLISQFARFNLDSVVDDVNEDILQPWADMLREKGVANSGPLSPFMEKELLKDADLCLDASRAASVLGWKPEEGRERVTKTTVNEVLESYKAMEWWPKD